jgi:hypothetical protein
MPDVISQSKIYADFGATASVGGAGGSAGGAILLEFAESLKDTDERSVDIVKAIGKKRGAGYRRKAGGGTIMITENRQNFPQVDWRKVKRDEKIFTITVQDENGGVRQKFLKCTVSKVDRSMSAEGEHQDEIEIKYLDAV